ncbi:MAG: FG-GAP-like repeat-containing protein, partial [Phycisphaerales bacterium]
PSVTDRAIFATVGGMVMLPGGVVLNQRLLVSGPLAPDATLDLAGGVYQLLNGGTTGLNRALVVGGGAGESGLLTLLGGTLLGDEAALGVDATANGTLTVDGTMFLALNGALKVGENGVGAMNVQGQALSGASSIGDGPGATGTVGIDGLGAFWIVLDELRVANAGVGDLSVTGGAQLVATARLLTAAMGGSTATIVVSGAGSAANVVDGTFISGDEVAAGGTASLSVENGAFLRAGTTLTVRPDGDATIDAARLEAEALLVDGGAVVATNQAALVVSDGDTTTDPGVHVGVGASTGVATVRAGGSLVAENGFIGREVDSTGTLTFDGASTSGLFSGDLLVGNDPRELARYGSPARLELLASSALDVGGLLAVRQRGRLRVGDGTATVGTFDLSDYGSVELSLPQAPSPGGAGIVADQPSSLGGGVIIDFPGAQPSIGTAFDLVRAPSLDGSPAVVGCPLLPVFKFISVATVPAAPSGEALHVEVKRLPILLNLATPTPSDIVSPPSAVALAKFDADAAPDAIVTLPAGDPRMPGNVQLLLNDVPAPGGVPGFMDGGTVQVGKDPVAVAQGDLDGDGKPDAVVSNRGSGTLTLVRNVTTFKGAGGLVVAGELIVGGTPGGLTIADLDGDKANDIAVVQSESNQLVVFFNDGTGGFGPGQYMAAGPDPQSVCPLDLDDDKDIDLLVVNFGAKEPTGPLDTPSVTVHINLGNGTFAPAVAYEVGLGATALADGDLNGDGIPEAVTANKIAGTISVLVGLADGTFLPAVDLDAGGFPTAIAAGDFDNDAAADIDIAVLVDDGMGGQKLNLFRNDSTGGQLVLTLVTDAQNLFGLPSALASGNADLDGPVDLVSVGEQTGGGGVAGSVNTGFISVFVAQPIVCPGDADGDGDVNGNDIGLLLASWNQTGDQPADFNDDGIVDGADLAILLSNWGGCV